MPDDDNQPLSIRADRLSQWCSGFLVGLGPTVGKVIETSSDKESLTELLSDLTEICKLQYVDDDTDENESERHWIDLIEYVKVAAMNLFFAVRIKASEQNDA